ncbi:MAG: pyruvate ferredoxin oxidoreductase [Patescibacteria group bacterium]|nr:pyruvate ferredoxin oxidoreductase [Patescibacteria group bacterium]
MLEGSRAIALTIKNIAPAVVSAYPITPQTHIVEDLAKFKADGLASYEYIRAESEFAAASIVAGASAAGVRVYSATSSQGLLLMAEVIFNIAGMRLPVVMTCANRAVSAPINIWNDQQDVMAIRDAGWILLFAENHQEAVNMHIMAFKLAEELKIPVMVNVDGYVMTHTYEPVSIPAAGEIKKYLPDYAPKPGQYLDPENPVTMGALATPAHYMEIRQELHDDLISSLKIIDQEYINFNKIFPSLKIKKSKIKNFIDNGLIEYVGPHNPDTIIVAMGSVVGTIKDAISSLPDKGGLGMFLKTKQIGILKIKCLRPFPSEQILKILKPAKHIAVIDKAISLGQIGPLASEIKTVCQDKIKTNINSFIVGLGGRDVTKEIVKKIIKQAGKKSGQAQFIGHLSS